MSQTPESKHILAVTQLKADFHLFTHCYQRSHPPPSESIEISIKKPKWRVHI